MSANNIFEIIKDYQCDYQDRKFDLSPEHVQHWADQFGDESEFVLSELFHFIPEIYISKEKAKELLLERLKHFQLYYKYNTMNELIINSHFFDVQKPEKSQGELLNLIDEILQQEHFIEYKSFQNNTKKHFIYFDDLLATGGTIFKDLKNWLEDESNGKKNYDALLEREITLAVSLFCCHSLGFSNIEWQLMKLTSDDIKKLMYFKSDYIIENNLKTKWIAESQRLNCAFPIDEQSKNVKEYFNSLAAEKTSFPAFRPRTLPKIETFFSSPENRIKLENLFVEKGIELLNKIKSDNPDQRKRPLGDTVRSHKTLGTGTLFFTWRNISNTCPLVFWWDVHGHDWMPLFCLKNRGV